MKISEAKCTNEQLSAFKLDQRSQFAKRLPARIDPDAEAIVRENEGQQKLRQMVTDMVQDAVRQEMTKSAPVPSQTMGTGTDANAGLSLTKGLQRQGRALTGRELFNGRY